MSVRSFFNYYILQWFCIRLTIHKETVINKLQIYECSVVEHGMALSGKVKDYYRVKWHSIQYWVKPLTGWNDKEFEYLNDGPKYLRLTKDKKI